MVTVSDAFSDYARQLESMADRLTSGTRPGHILYCSKAQAAEWAQAIAAEIRQLLESAPKQTLDGEL
jgi:hypothetical protein